jgi:hypothetical protein
MLKKTFFILVLSILSNYIQAQEGVKVTHNIPSVVKQGSEFTVDINMDKKGIEGFAKLQFSLPVGLSASNIESNGATFSFKDQLVNFVWMSLPEVESFKISFKINVSSTIFGEDSLSGNFSYMHNNEKQTYKITPFIIDIQLPGDQTASTKANSNPTTSNTTTNTAVAENNTKPTEVNAMPAVSETKVAEVVTTVENKENKAEKIVESNVILNNKDTANATSNAAASATITEVKKKEEPAASNDNKVVVPVKTAETPTKDSKNMSSEALKTEKPAPKTNGIPAQAGIIFKVQVAALGSQPKADAFSGLIEISNFKSPEGLNKYYTGKFNTYDEAAMHLAKVREKGFDQAFIAAFKNGSPVTIKEALGK